MDTAQSRPLEPVRPARPRNRRRAAGVSLKWRIAALTALLLVAFAALLSGAVLIVQNASLQQYQRGLLEGDAARLREFYKENDIGEAGVGNRGGVAVQLYNLDGSPFSPVRDALGVPPDQVGIAQGGAQHWWRGRLGREPVQVILTPIEVRLEGLSARKVLAVAASTGYILNAATAVGTAVVVVTAVLVVLALAGGYWAASFGLRPLVLVARQATRLDETNLEPLEYRGPRDELGLLAATLNGLVGRLRRAFDAQKTFLAETSHELRTPLTALEGYLHRAMREAPPEGKPVLEDALRVARTMTRLVADLLQLSRGDVVRELVPHLVDLGNLASGVAREFPGVNCHCPAGRAELIGDPDRLTQLTRNLVANAVRAAGRPEGVTLSVERVGDRVSLHVRDDGPGIPPEILPNIFAKFYRGPQGGSGLGLAIVAQIVRVHGGEVHVESSPGAGAHFWASFPAYQEE